MGPKDQDGYYAEKCHIFSTSELKYTNLKKVQIKSKNIGHYFVYKSHYFLTKQGWVH